MSNPTLCKYCMREIAKVKGEWLAIDAFLMFPKYCGWPWRPEQKHEPEKNNDEPQHHDEVD